MYMRIDKAKLRRRMVFAGITSFNELGEKTTPLGLGVRKLYYLLDSYDWNTQQLYALCQVLDCSVTDLLSFDLERIDPKVEAPSVRNNLSFNLANQGA